MFYVWLKLLYATLLCSALWLNRKDWRMFVLALVIGAGIFLPIPATVNPSLFYYQCILVELTVMLVAVSLWCRVSAPICVVHLIAIVMHVAGMYVGPQPGFGIYRAIVPVLDMGQLLLLISLSAPVLDTVQEMFSNDLESRQ